MILLAAVGGYWLWRFFPAYFDGWTVDHILAEAASQTYRLNRMQEPERTKELTALVDKTRERIARQASVGDPELVVNLDLEGDKVTVSADYKVVITHLLVEKTTTLRFHRHQSADVKRVRWE
jgi:hypothetical protein